MDPLSENARSCLDSAAHWRQQAQTLRDMAARSVNRPAVAQVLLREAEAADRQAQGWQHGATES